MLQDIIVEAASNNAKASLDRGKFIDLLKRNCGLAMEIMRKAIDRYESLIELQQTNIPHQRSISGSLKVEKEKEDAEDEWNGWLRSKKPKKMKHVI